MADPMETRPQDVSMGSASLKVPQSSWTRVEAECLKTQPPLHFPLKFVDDVVYCWMWLIPLRSYPSFQHPEKSPPNVRSSQALPSDSLEIRDISIVSGLDKGLGNMASGCFSMLLNASGCFWFISCWAHAFMKPMEPFIILRRRSCKSTWQENDTSATCFYETYIKGTAPAVQVSDVKPYHSHTLYAFVCICMHLYAIFTALSLTTSWGFQCRSACGLSQCLPCFGSLAGQRVVIHRAGQWDELPGHPFPAKRWKCNWKMR